MTAALYDLGTYREARRFYAGKKPPWPKLLQLRKAAADAAVEAEAELCGRPGPLGLACGLRRGHAGLCAATWAIDAAEPVADSTREDA